MQTPLPPQLLFHLNIMGDDFHLPMCKKKGFTHTEYYIHFDIFGLRLQINQQYIGTILFC